MNDSDEEIWLASSPEQSKRFVKKWPRYVTRWRLRANWKLQPLPSEVISNKCTYAWTSFSIGVGRGDWIRSSLPPNRTGGFPASGSPVSGSPPRGLTQRRLGLCKREQPLRGKESIGPALMIAPSAPTAPLLTLTQKAAQTHPEPGIQIRKGRVIAVLEIAKPASGDRVDARDDDLQALPIAALGQDANFVPQLFQALRARPSKSALEVIPKKVEAAMFRGV